MLMNNHLQRVDKMSEPLTRAELETMRERAEKMRLHPVAKHFSSSGDVLHLLDAYEQLLEVTERLTGGIPQRTWEGRITIDMASGTVTGQAIEQASEQTIVETDGQDET